MRTPLTLTLALSLALSASGLAMAQSKCDSAKAKELGKKVFCKMKVHSKSLKKAVPLDLAKLTTCETKFLDKCTKAETSGDCSTVGDCAVLELAADTCVENLTTPALSPICTENGFPDQCPFNDPCTDGFCAVSGGPCTQQVNCSISGEECCCSGICL